MVDKKLGVLGGMGPLATSVFFDRVIKNTLANTDQEHIDMIIINRASLPDRTLAIKSGETNAFLIFLNTVKADIKLLEIAKVANIVIPCNTSHYFFEQIQAMTEVNIINMIKHTVKRILKQDIKKSKVAILATDGTILSRVYEEECEKHNLESFIPQKDIQAQIMNIIYKIKSNASYGGVEINDIIRTLQKEEHCTTFILGCTELSCIKLDPDIDPHCIDPMDVLVEESILQSGKKLIDLYPKFEY